mgnify:FL=1
MGTTRTYRDIVDLLQVAQGLCFVFLTSDPEEDLPGDCPVAIPYIDDEPPGWEHYDTETIIISKDSPDWEKIRERVADILSLVNFISDKTYVLLDWKKSLDDELVTKKLTDLFVLYFGTGTDNFILPPRISDALIK